MFLPPLQQGHSLCYNHRLKKQSAMSDTQKWQQCQLFILSISPLPSKIVMLTVKILLLILLKISCICVHMHTHTHTSSWSSASELSLPFFLDYYANMTSCFPMSPKACFPFDYYFSSIWVAMLCFTMLWCGVLWWAAFCSAVVCGKVWFSKGVIMSSHSRLKSKTHSASGSRVLRF